MPTQSAQPVSLHKLPSIEEMYSALCERDSEYEGVFFVCVKTTGIFCRPTCSARKPLRKNVQFCRSVRDALSSGYRACKRCRPLEIAGEAPQWLRGLLEKIESDPTIRMTDYDLRQFGIEPSRVRRWFKTHHGMTFQAYQRARRLSSALGQMQVEIRSVTTAAISAGYDSPSGFQEAFQKLFANTPGKSDKTKLMFVNRILTKLGPMVCAADSAGVHMIEFADRRMLETQIKRVRKLTGCTFVVGENDFHFQLKTELEAYFEGRLRAFKTPIILKGTKFQEQVWQRLIQIDFGKTLSYETIAKIINNPKAQRAVGKANGDNRFAIVVPCHRVTRSDGSLSGYGGGIWRKRWLLDHEQTTILRS